MPFLSMPGTGKNRELAPLEGHTPNKGLGEALSFIWYSVLYHRYTIVLHWGFMAER
jgi:hypothetical protein